MKKIAIVDDDFSVEAIADGLRDSGYDVRRYASARAALDDLALIAASDLVILDVMMERPAGLDEIGSHGGHRTGVVLLRELRKCNQSLPVLVFTASQDRDAIQALTKQNAVSLVSKWIDSPDEVIQRVSKILGTSSAARNPQAFIVHGHDEVALLALKNYLQNILKLAEPIVLREQPSAGRTIIEKFEGLSLTADVVFVLLTPDDKMATGGETNAERRRARQNVIFELGFFFASLGRRSGRVILLHKGTLDLPSDIAGIIYIPIDDGIEAAGEQIRKELQHVGIF